MALAHATGSSARARRTAGPVVVQRNVHSSIIDGLVLSGLRPTFVAPEIDPELGIAHCVTPDALTRRSRRSRDAEAAMLVSPTYFGAVARLAELAEVAHARGSRWWSTRPGARTSTSTMPCRPGALRGGADLVLSSTHKIVGSLTQSAILHLGDGEPRRRGHGRPLGDAGRVHQPERAADRLARRRQAHAATKGQELLDETLDTLARTRERVREIPGLDVLDERLAGRTSVAA